MTSPPPHGPSFLAAQPVWPAGRAREMNRFAGFRARFDRPAGGPVVVRLTASAAYRLSVNGRFAGYGPARAPHGHFRVDVWDVTAGLQPGENLVAVEVAGYNVNSYYLLDQPSFLQAEVVSEGLVLAATGGDEAPFEATLLDDHVQKVQRYSVARTFSEVFRLRPGLDAWCRDPAVPLAATPCDTFGEGRLLPRSAPYPDFTVRRPLRHVAAGAVRPGVPVAEPWRDWSLECIGPDLKGFFEHELEVIPSLSLQEVVTVARDEVGAAGSGAALELGPDTFHLLDFGVNRTGFLGLRVACPAPARLYALFDEVLTEGDVDFTRLRCVNVVAYELAPGAYDVETFEPYTLRYLKLLVLGGRASVADVYLREYANPDVHRARFACSDEGLVRLFEAGRETYRQNAVDLLMDCPSRERAGWLCDSFYTGRAGAVLSGHAGMERAYLENYLLPERFDDLPDGMLPMNYPADHPNGKFIPNWALWLVLELEEYLARSGDRALVDAFRPKVERLFAYFDRFRNDDGLLERLESWVFVEWSAANDFVQDVNYPTNMLYAAALAAAGRLYDRADYRGAAEHVRRVVRAQAFDGTFFVDNAVRVEGRLVPTRNRTEVCQLYAFHYDVATPGSHPALWRRVLEAFGPHRQETGAFPDVHPMNALIGYALRLDVLARYGHAAQALAELRAYFLPMAGVTGTLWEHHAPVASCNHGYASYVTHNLFRDALGVDGIDPVGRLVRLRRPAAGLGWCEGQLPVGGDVLALRWERTGGGVTLHVVPPPGYTIQLDGEACTAGVITLSS